MDKGSNKRIAKFTYETRTTSRDFCKNLTSKPHIIRKDKKLSEIKSVSEEITNNNWFSSSWKNDPTIKSMLNMLDSIHALFKNANLSEFFNLLSGNADDDCPLYFYFLDLGEYNLGDSIYIKLNARGKDLTCYENFKAKLSKYINDELDTPKDGDDYERAISKGVRRLLPYSSDIISHLAEITEYSGYGFDSDCFEEECLKAKLMKRDDEWKELILNAEDNKYFNGQIGFLLEAAGILSKYENGEIDGWTAEEDKNSKNAFRKYLKIYGSIFGEFEYGSKKEKYVGINRSFANNLRRALLCKGDYHLDDSNNSSFLVDFDRDISWKRLLRIQSNEKHGTYKTRRKMLMDLINDPLFDINDIGGGLINICNRDIGKITNWRKYFISVPGVMDALHDYSAYKPKERYIRIEGDNIFLMGSTRLYGYNKEYYSFALCCMLECLGKYSVRYEDAKGWEDIHHQIEVTEKSTGEVYEIKYRRSDKKFSIYKKDGSATVYANLEDTFNALK